MKLKSVIVATGIVASAIAGVIVVEAFTKPKQATTSNVTQTAINAITTAQASVDSMAFLNSGAKVSVDSFFTDIKSQVTPAIAKINFSAPVVTPPITPTVNTQPAYTISGPINAKSNTTYSNLLIDLTKTPGSIGIDCQGVTNVHITNCKIINGARFGINAYNCSNLVIDGNFISNIGFGIYVQKTVTAKVNNNQILNVNGIDTRSLGHAIQFNGVTGRGSQINNNRIENIDGVALHPHDIINVFKSDGLPGDSIQVIGNWIRGGQRTMWPTNDSGAAGIVVGDLGGSYQVCRNNILVNPGYVGIQAQGGSHIKVDHNLIYSDANPVSLVGVSWGNYSGVPSADVIYAYNKCRFYTFGWRIKSTTPSENSFTQNGSGLILVNNTWGADIDASILPTTIITRK
jgi:hypothetical protein